ncbi:hypothetical protein KUTeg_004365 [Tegillarca granosa]|uniref:Uncharacterized protein n=1 Tax=Tegillarca granosa TaxID=220873 RepID=A0ABQ9FPQ8_TEGGR|nr:hypothetical protein KUTeg_004365 [Tegillarca granosa]
MDNKNSYDEIKELFKTLNFKLENFKGEQNFTSHCSEKHDESLTNEWKKLNRNMQKFLTEKDTEDVVEWRNKNQPSSNISFKNERSSTMSGDSIDSGISSVTSELRGSGTIEDDSENCLSYTMSNLALQNSKLSLATNDKSKLTSFEEIGEDRSIMESNHTKSEENKYTAKKSRKIEPIENDDQTVYRPCQKLQSKIKKSSKAETNPEQIFCPTCKCSSPVDSDSDSDQSMKDVKDVAIQTETLNEKCLPYSEKDNKLIRESTVSEESTSKVQNIPDNGAVGFQMPQEIDEGNMESAMKINNGILELKNTASTTEEETNI